MLCFSLASRLPWYYLLLRISGASLLYGCAFLLNAHSSSPNKITIPRARSLHSATPPAAANASRRCAAARSRPRKRGEGCVGRDRNSGWNCAATKYGCGGAEPGGDLGVVCGVMDRLLVGLMMLS